MKKNSRRRIGAIAGRRADGVALRMERKEGLMPTRSAPEGGV